MDIINRRYNTIPLEKKYNEYIGKYNNFLIIHKLDPSNKQNENYFENNKNNIIFLIEQFNAVLDNLNIEIVNKESYLHNFNELLNSKKIINRDLKNKLKELNNSNAGAVAMYNDMKHMYNYTLIEYILIIVGIIIVIYDFK